MAVPKAQLLMSPGAGTPLRTETPWRVLDGFGRAVSAACHYAAPRSIDELAETLARAQAEGMPVAFRGSGRSYGDAALNERGLILDTRRINRLLRWSPEAGILEAEPGLTIEGLWRRTIEDGFWPAVVPGTMHPTLGGCVAMNIHGKNNAQVGPFGEHVLELDLLTADGRTLRCTPEENPELFHGVIGGLGLLGVVTRVKLKLKRVESGLLRVESLTAWDLDEMFDVFEERLPASDYLVGWMDCIRAGSRLGRGVLHVANYLKAEEDPEPGASLHVERQGLPSRIFGLPRSQLWRMMRPFLNNLGMCAINELKFQASRQAHAKTYLQSHVAFAFLLDYIPDWRLAYGPEGFIQHQIFVPAATARACLRDVLDMSQREELPPYLGVLKRHRPDRFLLSHALDGWSLAMDFRVPPRERRRLWRLMHRITERVLEAGGKFYFAKDAVLRAADAERAYGREKLDRFLDLKRKLDPNGLFSSNLATRALGLQPTASPGPA